MSSLTTAQVNTWLAMMEQLEGEYPSVRFVYNTGHTDGTVNDTLDRNNNLVRAYALAHNKVLYDFADIESWLPMELAMPLPVMIAHGASRGAPPTPTNVRPTSVHELRPLRPAQLRAERQSVVVAGSSIGRMEWTLIGFSGRNS